MTRAAGSWLIANMVKDMAELRGLSLKEITWVPDPAGEDADEYQLVLVAGSATVQQIFQRETLEEITQYPVEKERVKTLLDALLDRLASTL